MSPRTRSLILTLVALVPLLAHACPAEAKKVKVWKYETRDGKIDFGSELPPGAVALEEIGEIDAPDLPPAEPSANQVPSLSAPPAGAVAGDAPPARIRTHVERAFSTLSSRPALFGAFVAGAFLWSVLLLRIFSTVFRTLDLSWDRAFRMVCLIVAGVVALALVGQGLEYIWSNIGWSPRAEFGAQTVAMLSWALYGLVAIVVFKQRLGVGIIQAAALASLWFALVVGAAALVWIYLDAAAAVSGTA